MSFPIAYEDLDVPTQDIADHAIDTFCRYMNHLGDTAVAEDFTRVTREMLFEEGPQFGPFLLNRSDYGHRFANYTVFTFSFDPFHDEGGPSQVVAIYRDYGNGELLHDTYLWEFDTTWTIIPDDFYEDRFVRDVTADVNEGRK